MKAFLIINLALLCLSQAAYNQSIPIKKGMKISKSCKLNFDDYSLLSTKQSEPIIRISGNNMVVDFQYATMSGSKIESKPEKFKGNCILIENAHNVLIKNVTIHGYKLAIHLINCSDVTIENTNLSYNFRPQLQSGREKENESDWLSYHNNEKQEWIEKGSGIYIENSKKIIIRNAVIKESFNGIMLSKSDSCLIYNNQIQFNSGIGIGLYRSSNNDIQSNYLDYNVRGFSYGYYKRGQDSAGILVYEQSSNNNFAYNSATHCGDGFFLWAGQSSMDTGTGGCNNNLLYGNDFSYAITNGIEATFSSNTFYNNKVKYCENGFWLGYSYNTLLFGNQMADNKTDIAWEHGQDNSIRYNLFDRSFIGIKLWARNEQPKDWGYSKFKDAHSQNFTIERNRFSQTVLPFDISKSTGVSVKDNLIDDAEMLLEGDANITFSNNECRKIKSWGKAEVFKSDNQGPLGSLTIQGTALEASRLRIPAKRPDALDTPKDLKIKEGLDKLSINQYGPYSYEYPKIILTKISTDTYRFKVEGPAGIWTNKNTKGCELERSSGNQGQVIQLKVLDKANFMLELEWQGAMHNDQFGTRHGANEKIILQERL